MKKIVLLFVLFALGSCGSGESAPQGEVISSKSELDEYLGSWSTSCVDLNTLSVNSIDPPLYLMHSYHINEQTISKTIGFYDDPDCLKFNSNIKNGLAALGISAGDPFSFDIDAVTEIKTADGFDALKITLVDSTAIAYLLIVDGFLYDFEGFSFPEVFYDGEESDLVVNLDLPYEKQ